MYISVKLLTKYANPLVNPPWVGDIKPITHEEITEACKNPTHPGQEYDAYYGESRAEHINRIAWLVVHGWLNDPIEIHMGDAWVIFDGNHRLAAAIYRGDEMINADVYGSKEKIAVLYQDEGLTT